MKSFDTLISESLKDKEKAWAEFAKEVHGWKTSYKAANLRNVSSTTKAFYLTSPTQNRRMIAVTISKDEATIRVVGEPAGWDGIKKKAMNKVYFDKKFKTAAEFKKIVDGVDKKYDELLKKD